MTKAAKQTRAEEALDLLMAGYKHANIITSLDRVGFYTIRKPQPELIQLCEIHEDWFIAMFERPIFLRVGWEDDADEAIVGVLPGTHEALNSVRPALKAGLKVKDFFGSFALSFSKPEIRKLETGGSARLQ